MSKQLYKQITIQEEKTVKQVLEELNLDLSYFAILVNGKSAALETIVRKDDKVIIIPQIKGG